MSSLPEQMRERTKKFALRIVKLFRFLPRSAEAQVMGKQLLRSGTSVAANYRAVCRARSSAQFLAKMGIVIEEADETVFWLELLVESVIARAKQMDKLFQEANELLAIFAASAQTARRKYVRAQAGPSMTQ